MAAARISGKMEFGEWRPSRLIAAPPRNLAMASELVLT
jgi:hypothetical protein